MIDGDKATVVDRVASLDAACRNRDIETRKPDEPVAVFVPRRNIETWIAYLEGDDVDESREHRKLERASECDAGVRELKQMCDRGTLRAPAPPSLADACAEYDARLRAFPILP